MNGSSAINYPTNEQLVGKFHVTNVDKLPVNTLNNHDEIIPQTSAITDESGCASRFQMIRVDRNFGRGRWKVNDYEPPENTSSISTNPPVNTIENESINILNVPGTVLPIIPTAMPLVGTGDSNATSSATLAATAASAAAAAATAFQQQQHPIMVLNNAPTVVPTGNIPPPTGLMHPYPPGPLPNQSYLLPNHHHHHQFGYYPFYPPPYSPYAGQWAAALAASNPFLQPPTLGSLQQQAPSQISSTANLTDLNRLTDSISDINSENTMMSSNTFPNLTADHLQNAQLAAAAASYLYAAHHARSQYVPQPSSTASTYATIPAYHPVQHPPTILPPQTLPLSQIISNNPTDIYQSHQAPTITSPKHDGTKTLIPQPSFITTPKTKPLATTIMNGINNDLISSTPAPPSLISPLNITATNAPPTSLSDIWTYTTSGTPLNLTQTAQTVAVSAVAAMSLLNNENSQNTEIANEILKELTTPTKQNNTTDIDNKISAAMDLVKMHLLSAVREEVTELRQQIRTLNEKINSVEHENVFLRQHVSSEIYAQYIPAFVTLSSSNDLINSTSNPLSSIPPVSSSLPVPMTSLSSIPSSLVQQPPLSTTNPQPSLSTTNLSTT